MKTDSKKTSFNWAYLVYSIVIWLFILSRMVRDVQQNGLESALHFWGMLFGGGALVGLVIGVVTVIAQRRSRREETPGNQPEAP